MSSLGRWAGRAAGVAVLTVLALRLGSEPFVRGLTSVGPAAVAAALTVGALTTLASGWRWRLVARHLGIGSLPLRTAVAACYRSQLLNAALPGGVVGDVHRAVDHGRRSGATGLVVRSVAWERGLGQLVQVALTLLALRLWLPGAVALGVLAAALVRFRPVALGVVVASVVALAGYALLFVVAASAAGSSPPLTVVLLVLLAAAVPLNLGGWGPREGAAAWAFASVGLGAAQGVAASVAYGVLALVSTLPGLAVLLLTRSAPRPRLAATPEVSRA
jgi:hypothetical protein